MEDDEEGKDEEGPIEVFGVHRLQLALGTKSGYIGIHWRAALQVEEAPVAGVAFTQGREAQERGIIQGASGCCGGQGSGKGQRCPFAAESTQAGSAQ